MQFTDLESPFAIYDNGSGYVLPNVLPEMARNVLTRLTQEPIDDVLESLRNSGRLHLSPEASVQDVEKIWSFFLSLYLTEDGRDTPSVRTRIEMMRLMLNAPPDVAWRALRDRIFADIDDLSGWSRSFQKELGDRDQIWRGEDGKYYKNEDGSVYQVIGAKTLQETRLDFLTEQVARDFGTIRQFLQLFALLAVSEDYVAHREHYPTSMKAIVQDRKWPSLSHRWSLLQWHPVRTVIWRPWSNFCDPQWLAGDFLAAITDTLKIEPFRTARLPDGSECQLGPEFVMQADFALDTNLRIGEEEVVVLRFEGREFRWINASLESDTRVSVGLRKDENWSVAGEDLNRFLSVMVWEHGTPVAIKSGPIGGAKRALPLIISPRSIFSLKVEPTAPIHTNAGLIGPTEKLLLSIYREAVNARSVFYAFLNYWKVIEVVFPKKDARLAWVEKEAALLPLERERVRNILKRHPSVADYLDYNCRSAVVHVFRKPFIDPDSNEDFVRLKLDIPIARNLAKVAMRTLPAFF
jgi:hypothetical protein